MRATHLIDRRGAFTLFELLVVTAVIGVLVALLLPLLRTARDTANRAGCASNMRQIGAAMAFYASDNQGRLPDQAVDPLAWDVTWLHDLPRHTRDLIAQSGASRNVLYCPSESDMNSDFWWNFTYPTDGAQYCVIGYFLMIQRETGYHVPFTAPDYYLKNIREPNPVARVLGSDRTLYFSGSWRPLAVPPNHELGTTHTTPFGLPVGGNVLFLDSHVVWKSFDQMHMGMDLGGCLHYW